MNTLVLISLNHDPLGPMGETHVGGQAKYALEVSKNLSLKGWKIALFTVTQLGLPEKEDISDNCILYRIPRENSDTYNYDMNESEAKDLGDKIILRLATECITPELVYGCFWLSGIAGSQVSHFFSIPLVFTFCQLGTFVIQEEELASQNYQLPKASLLDRIAAERKVCTNASAIIATNRDELNSIVRDYDISRHKVHFIPRGVDLQRFFLND